MLLRFYNRALDILIVATALISLPQSIVSHEALEKPDSDLWKWRDN